MKDHFNIGIGFGVASGVITTLGLMIGLFAGTHSRGYVLAGILTIAITDAFSDAAGIHFSEESKGANVKDIWKTTIVTFFFKFIIAISFMVSFIFFSLNVSIIFNIIWSFLLIFVFSYVVAKKRKESPTVAVLEHFIIVISVIIITYYTGKVIERFLL